MKLGSLVYNTILASSVALTIYGMWKLPDRDDYPLVKKAQVLEDSRTDIISAKNKLDSALDLYYNSSQFNSLDSDLKTKMLEERKNYNSRSLDSLLVSLNNELSRVKENPDFSKQDLKFKGQSQYYGSLLMVNGIILMTCLVGQGMYKRLTDLKNKEGRYAYLQTLVHDD